MTPILAHSWGWDEILYFAIPVALALLWVRRIEKRANARKQQEAEETAAGEGTDPDAKMARPEQS